MSDLGGNDRGISYGRIHRSKDGGVGRIVLDNPDRLNAISIAMWHEIVSTLDDFERDPDIRCVLFEGQGDKAFSAGADLSEKQTDPGHRQTGTDGYVGYCALQRVQSFSKPTIAVISGYCLGAGMALAIACDLRIANADAQFAIPAARLGLALEFSLIERLVQLLGQANTKRVLFLAERFSGVEALRIGLLDELASPENLRSVGESLAGRIATNAPLTLASIKYGIETVMAAPERRDLPGCASRERRCMESDDYVEGLRAFREKRAPNFRGV